MEEDPPVAGNMCTMRHISTIRLARKLVTAVNGSGHTNKFWDATTNLPGT